YHRCRDHAHPGCPGGPADAIPGAAKDSIWLDASPTASQIMSTHGQAESQKPRPAKKISKPAASSRPSARRPRGRGKYPDGLPRPRRYWAVLTLMSVLVIVVLDSTMVNVALPTIAADLSIDPAAVVRVVIAYNVTVVVTLLIFSSIAERIGFRLMFGIGVGLFG